MKLFLTIILSVGLFACGGGEPNTPKPIERKAVFLLFENGGSVPANHQEEAFNTALHLLQQFTHFADRKATQGIQINLVTSALPNRIAWSGTAKQLREQVDNVKAILTFKQSFSDIGMAFETIGTTIDIQQPTHVSLYTIGPFVNVPFQDIETEIEVKVPQAIPSDLALPDFLNRLTTLKIYRVHPDQVPTLNAYLTANGVQSRASKGMLDFTLLGEAQTRSNLNNLL